MKLKLGKPIGFLAEGDIRTLKIVCSDIRFQIGEILIIQPPKEQRVFLFRVMNYENIVRNIQDLSSIAANFVRNREAYIARIESDKLVKVHGLLMGYSEYELDSKKWIFKKPRSLPPHFSEVFRGSDSPKALETVLKGELGTDIEIGNLLIGTSQLEDVPVSIDLESLPMHVQVAGTTGAGKSFFMLTFITSVLKRNLQNWITSSELNKQVSVFMVDVHDEYMRGLPYEDKIKGVLDISNTVVDASLENYNTLFADKFYLIRDLEAVSDNMQKFSKALRFRREDVVPTDISSVMYVTDQMSGYMNYMKGKGDWISAISDADETDDKTFVKGTLSAVKRRLLPLIRSPIFTKDPDSDLAEIIYNLEKGHFYNFSTALLSSTEQFVVITMIARTLFALRQALMSSTKWDQFKQQVYDRLPKKIASELLGEISNKKYSIKPLYTSQGNEMKSVRDLPVVMLTVEEAPSILGSQMSKEGNIFIDISRQGRKFRIGLLLITQNISAMEPLILANTNTELNMMLGNEIEIRQAIINASNNITGYENEFKVLSRGEAILTNSLKNIPLPVKVSNVPLYIENELKFFKNPHKAMKVQKMAKNDTDIPIM